MTNGRPLRFLVGVTGGWSFLRIVMLWPTIDSAPALLRAIVPLAAAEPLSVTTPTHSPIVVRPSPRSTPRTPAPAHSQDVPLAVLSVTRENTYSTAPTRIVPGLPSPVATPHSSGAARRLSGSFWLIARGAGGASAGLIGGQLGGSQAGVRIAYALDVRHRVAAAVRVTSPLGAGQRELAVGIEWQPTRLPVRIIAEQRIALGAGVGGPTLGVVGGAGPVEIGAGFRLEGYGQAGVIGRRSADGGAETFVDGAVRLGRPIATLGRVRVDGGAGLWGAAQRGASRLDIGPSLAVVLPVARQAMRLSIDWRERVAGDARPGSGPAVTLGADF